MSTPTAHSRRAGASAVFVLRMLDASRPHRIRIFELAQRLFSKDRVAASKRAVLYTTVNGSSGAFSNIQQRMRAVGEIENPQHGHIRCRGILVSPDRPIESTFSKLRLTFWQRVDV